MIIKTIDRLTLPTNISKSIGLCYFDPETESLKEFSTNETLLLTPFESTVKRYYLAKVSDFINNKTPTYASISIESNNTDIDIKINAGKDLVTSKYDYYDIPVNNTIIVFFNEYPSGIIPLDIYFKSNGNKNIDSSFKISIKVE